jgi:glycosyltransferase involved in cell wall biosynthesis
MPLLVNVWRQVHRLCSGAQLVVVGDGPYRARMESELTGTHTHFVGFRHGRELSTIYASADLFVFPSTTDTLGQVVMESQSSGLPVIVTDQGGPKEVVRQGETGLILPSDIPERWVREIAALIRDEPRRAQWGADAHAAIQPMSIRHSFEHFWDSHVHACEGARGGIGALA